MNGRKLKRAPIYTRISTEELVKICPHGRPVVKRTRLSELLKEFGRA